MATAVPPAISADRSIVMRGRRLRAFIAEATVSHASPSS
jgi:hypothetical protein